MAVRKTPQKFPMPPPLLALAVVFMVVYIYAKLLPLRFIMSTRVPFKRWYYAVRNRLCMHVMSTFMQSFSQYDLTRCYDYGYHDYIHSAICMCVIALLHKHVSADPSVFKEGFRRVGEAGRLASLYYYMFALPFVINSIRNCTN